MAISVTHSFQSAKSDGSDSSLVQPSNWNAAHAFTMATARLLGRTTAAAGSVEEITVGSGLTLSAGTLSASAGLTVGSSAISSGTTLRLLYDNAGVLGETAGITFPGTGQLTMAAGTITTSQPALNITQTWNAGGVQFTSIFTNISITAASGLSLLLDLQRDSFSYFSVRTDGEVAITDATAKIRMGARGYFGSDGSIDGAFRIMQSDAATGATIAAGASNMLQTKSSSFSRNAVVTKTADFTLGAAENWVINNKSGSTCTVTLPSAATFTGREIHFQNNQAQTLVSASSNVVPKGGGSAATAILPATATAWAILVSDGTNWIVMISGT